MLCNTILERYGSDIFTEKMDYKVLVKRAKSEEEEFSRGKKKRFGASIGKNAPGRFIGTLKQKLGYIGKTITVVDLYGFKASQYDHVKDAYEKHGLDERWKDIGGMLVQRDLYSGFLLRNAEEPTEEGPPKKPDRQKCMDGFTSFLRDQYECITDMLGEGISNKAVFGF